MPITNFVVSVIMKEYLQAATAVFRDGKCGPARCAYSSRAQSLGEHCIKRQWRDIGTPHKPRVKAYVSVEGAREKRHNEFEDQTRCRVGIRQWSTPDRDQCEIKDAS